MLHLLPQFKDKVDIRFLGKDDSRELEEPYVRLTQVHGSTSVVVREHSINEHEADGSMTDKTGLTLLCRAADCQNFAVYAPEHHICGVLHSGWKGLLAGAIPAFVRALEKEWGISAADVHVAAGPSLCQQCAEFTDPASELSSVDPKFFDGRFVDLQGIADAQLFDCGIVKENFHRHPDCTRCNPQAYLTYRGGDRELVASGVSNFLVCTLL